MRLIPAEADWEQQLATKKLWDRCFDFMATQEGLAFYKHPALVFAGKGLPPQLTILARDYGALVCRVEPIDASALQEVSATGDWIANSAPIDSPLAHLEDIQAELLARFNRERTTRNAIRVRAVLFLPHLTRHQMKSVAGSNELEHLEDVSIIYEDTLSSWMPDKLYQSEVLSDTQWRMALSILQGVNPLTKRSPTSSLSPRVPGTIGEALRELDKQIALLDDHQLAAAIPIAPGPQRIRGLAGTGKTILLAMKVAQIHAHYPERRVLFTFFTQSLYNQARSLIRKFYNSISGELEPNWDQIHVLHAWGNREQTGVYRDACARQNIAPMDLNSARTIDPDFPFRAACVYALKQPHRPFYDHIMVDEAQDLPQPFFELLWHICTGGSSDRAICFAYDELQSLSKIEMPDETQLFGKDQNGEPRVSLEGTFPGGIERDITLLKSYRCPHAVMMLAHSIGLGLKAKGGPFQMLYDRASWEAVGYELENGDVIAEGKKLRLYRPPENSPNPIHQLFPHRELVEVRRFDERAQEFEFLAEQIRKDVVEQGVPPEQILVVWYDPRTSRDFLPKLQLLLLQHKIGSIIPGVVDRSSSFGESGSVTLVSPYRAKGNEASIVYLCGLDRFGGYVDPVESRNRAFTAISRSKGWVVLSGVGQKMESVEEEVRRCLDEQPYVSFVVPRKENVARNLDAKETLKRREMRRRARNWARGVASLDREAIQDLDEEELARIRALVLPEDEQ